MERTKEDGKRGKGNICNEWGSKQDVYPINKGQENKDNMDVQKYRNQRKFQIQEIKKYQRHENTEKKIIANRMYIL